MKFQVSFTPLPGCFSPFPHGTGYAIGRQLVFSLGGWSPLIHTGFLESRATRDHSQLSSCISPTGLSPSPVRFPNLFSYTGQIRRSQPNCIPLPQAFAWFRLLPFRSPLLRESLRFLLLRVLRCFTSPGLAPFRVTDVSASRVSPFGYLGINARLQLPRAFRSLPRPSSPSAA